MCSLITEKSKPGRPAGTTDIAGVKDIISRFGSVLVAVVGDLMLDSYVWGRVSGLSPEAPVPVLDFTGETISPGGAANVASNLAAMGASVRLFGVVGGDPEGRALESELKKLGVETGFVAAERGRRTAVKRRIMADNRQAIRIDRETTEDIRGETAEKIIDSLRGTRPDAVIVSDYAKGTMVSPLVKAVREWAAGMGIPAIADPKTRNMGLYGGYTVITPNKNELMSFMKENNIGARGIPEAGPLVAGSIGCRNLLVTMGGEGMLLFEENSPPYAIRAWAREVFDVTGAGDTAVAALGASLAAGAGMRAAAETANCAAGIAVGKTGTAPVKAEELFGFIEGKLHD